jgi:hypothetical protein
LDVTLPGALRAEATLLIGVARGSTVASIEVIGAVSGGLCDGVAGAGRRTLS